MQLISIHSNSQYHIIHRIQAPYIWCFGTSRCTIIKFAPRLSVLFPFACNKKSHLLKDPFALLLARIFEFELKTLVYRWPTLWILCVLHTFSRLFSIVSGLFALLSSFKTLANINTSWTNQCSQIFIFTFFF